MPDLLSRCPLLLIRSSHEYEKCGLIAHPQKAKPYGTLFNWANIGELLRHRVSMAAGIPESPIGRPDESDKYADGILVILLQLAEAVFSRSMIEDYASHFPKSSVTLSSISKGKIRSRPSTGSLKFGCSPVDPRDTVNKI
jgi:hypothetical protein